jgi:hypothetical protein
MSQDGPELTTTATRAHANALGILALCKVLRDKGVLEDDDLWTVRDAMVGIIERSPMPASPEVNAMREQFDAEFRAIIKRD